MLLALAAFCTLLEALFTALEVALGAVPRSLLRHIAEERLEPTEENGAAMALAAARSQHNSARAEAALVVTDRPERLAMLFITVTSLCLWVAAGSLTWQAIHSSWPLGTLLLTLVGVLFVAEVLPLVIAARNAEYIVLRSVGFIALALRVLGPVLWVIERPAFMLARALGGDVSASAALTEGELRSVLATAEEEGTIESDERAMLEGAMDFRAKVVREVMTPRVDILAVAAQTSLKDTLHLALQEGYSRLPVYENSIDHVIGVVATKDLLPFLRDGQAGEGPVREVIRPVHVVMETKLIADTLEELRRQRTLLALVMDADGGTAGVVTMEDLLEELVGEIQDEYDVEEEPLCLQQEGDVQVVRCEGGSTVREFGRFWKRSLPMSALLLDREGNPAEPSCSLAALALNLFEKVPGPGDRIACGRAHVGTPDIKTSLGLQLEIEAMDGPRIEFVVIRPVQAVWEAPA